jgi:hypothetical protein
MEEKIFINPIDPKKVAQNPGLLPYAHNAASAIVRPIDKGKAKGIAVRAMYEQSNSDLDQIRKQVELLAVQAKMIHDRVAISEKIYKADMNFKPVIGYIYHLYIKKDASHVLSMIAPEEWGAKNPYTWLATCRLLADHTWDVHDCDGELLYADINSVEDAVSTEDLTAKKG